MHLVSENLDTSVTLLTGLAGVVALSAACYDARSTLKREQVPALMAMTGFVLIAQMVNCSMGLGFSGHFLGAGLLAILFGPCAAMLSMAAVLTGQAAFFGDGSMSTLGANFLNMGVVAPWAAHFVFRLLQGRRSVQLDAGQFVATGVAAYASTLAAAGSLALIAGSSATEMLGNFAVIGLFEVALSLVLFALCAHSVRDTRSSAMCSFTLKPIVCACLLALCLAPFSSQLPDGLESVLAAPVAVVK